MLSIITLLNKTAQTYLQSLKRDLSNNGFESIIIIVSISWVGLFIAAGLLVTGNFSMPTDPLFYWYWFALALVTTSQFIIILIGLVKANFFAANSVGQISFVVTIAYAILFLGESITNIQVVAIILALSGTVLFFKKHSNKQVNYSNSQGLLLILSGLLISPLGVIFYKSATIHTSSYTQFLTGRLIMDALYYSLFMLILFLFWYRKNPLPNIGSFISSKVGITFMIGSAVANLLDSWLIYKLPVITFTILGTITIVASYVIGRMKYKENTTVQFVIGGLLIIAGVVVFALKNNF